jgi:phosphoglycolate phosphatase
MEDLNRLRAVTAVIFDFDGTLAVLNIDFSDMREQVFRLMPGFGIEEESVTERYLLEAIDQGWAILEKKNPLLAAEFYERAHQVLHEVEMKAAEGGGLLPGTEETLARLRSSGLKVGIVTRNCEAAVRKVFPAIDCFCDAFIPRNSVKRVKPHPDHLNAVMSALGVSGEEAVMVGDHPIDILSGKRAGMKTVGVLTGRTSREEFEKAGADMVLNEVGEMRGLWFQEGDKAMRR